MKVVVYESAMPLRGNEKFLAWLTEDRAVVDKKGNKTGEVKTCFLPVYFFGETGHDARERALAFWDDKKAKKAALEARGKVVGKLRATGVKRAA